MEEVTKFESLTEFVSKILFTLKDFAYDLYTWLLTGIEFDVPNLDGGVTHYSLTGLDIIGAIAITWFTARVVGAIVDAVIPN